MMLLQLAVTLGVVAGGALAVSGIPRPRRPHLAIRLDPYLHGLQPRRSRLLAVEEAPLTPFPTLERLARPLLQEAARLVDSWLGGSASVARRLRQAGWTEGVARFRAEQVVWATVGFVTATLTAVVLPGVLGRPVLPLVLLGAAAFGVVGGILVRDQWLTHEVARRHAAILSEFPTVADLLCLAVTAGESPRAALERVVRQTHGQLRGELAVVLADLQAGMPLTAALGRLAVRVQLLPVARFVDALVIAIERGTPLAELLRAQASDVRQQRKRELLEMGGRKEVLMLVPVVFMMLPVVVLFALYPGVFALSTIGQ